MEEVAVQVAAEEMQEEMEVVAAVEVTAVEMAVVEAAVEAVAVAAVVDVVVTEFIEKYKAIILKSKIKFKFKTF